MRDPKLFADAAPGLLVSIATGHGAMQGKIKTVLTTRDNPKGVKVELETGEKGRILQYIEEKDLIKPLKEVPVEDDKKVLEQISDNTVIEIEDTDIQIDESLIFTDKDTKKFEVVTKFFKQTYIKKIKNDVYGIVIFKVNAYDLNIAVYKINLYLKTYCVSKDVKYEVIKTTST